MDRIADQNTNQSTGRIADQSTNRNADQNTDQGGRGQIAGQSPSRAASQARVGVQAPNPWSLYDTLIDGIPDDIAIRDYCLGQHWSYVDAECGMGISFTVTGGAKGEEGQDFRGQSLKSLAHLAKSWNFSEATLGIAAINAWYSQADKIEACHPLKETKEILPDGTKLRRNDAFEIMRPKIQACNGTAKVVVVGHFPHVADIAEYAHLTVLERNCRNEFDTPDPACEYLMPQADFAFITGVTLTNKTAPRLLRLAANATTTLVGPSVIMSPIFFDYGVDLIAGSVVKDPEHIAFSCRSANVGIPFGEAFERVAIQRG